MTTWGRFVLTVCGGVAAHVTAEENQVNWTEACRNEVVELHQFFEDWANAELPDSDEAFGRLSSVVAEGFELVSPEGGITTGEVLLQSLRTRHGAERDRGYRIWIESPRCRVLDENLLLVVYEEWQEVAGDTRGRVSSAVLRKKSGTPNGLEWLHVHETWLPEREK